MYGHSIALNGVFGNVTATYEGTEHRIQVLHFSLKLHLSKGGDSAVIRAAS